MDTHQLMLFHFSQEMTRDIATFIANYYKLPASTVDEIERKNPGITLVRALEQRLIICKDVKKLKEFHGLLKSMKFNDLAKIIEDSYPEMKEGTNAQVSTTSQSTPASTNPPGPNPQSPDGETTDSGGVLMNPTSTAQPTSGTRPGEATDGGNVMTKPSDN